MSVIVKHRTDLDTVAAESRRDAPVGRCLRRVAKSGQGHLRRHPRSAAGRPRRRNCCFAEDLAARGWRSGPPRSRCVRSTEHVAWNEQRDFKEASATLAKSSDDRRVFDSCSTASSSAPPRPRPPARASPSRRGKRTQQQRHQPRHAPAADRGRAEGRIGRRPARPRPPGDRRLRPRRGLGVLGVDVQRIRRALGLRDRASAGPANGRPEHDGLRGAAQKFSST